MPADFCLEDEEAEKAHNKAISAGALVLLIANSQGAEKILCPRRIVWNKRSATWRVWIFRTPMPITFLWVLWEACPHSSMPGSHPDSSCPRLFQTVQSGTHDPISIGTAAMNDATNGQLIEDINVELAGMARPMAQEASPTQMHMAPPKRLTVAQMPTEQGRQEPEAADTFTSMGLVMAHSQDVLRSDPNGENTTNTINRAELVGVQACRPWLKQVNQLESPLAITFKLLTVSQMTLQSNQKASK